MSSPPTDRLAFHATWALAIASIRYWTGLAPYVRAQVDYWQERAGEIADPALRELALAKLTAERFNAEAAAMIATAAPAANRRAAVRAIVALELMYDCLDGLSELPRTDPIVEGEALYEPFLAAIEPAASTSGEGYLWELADAARAAIAELPAREQIAESALRCAQIGMRAQVLMHAAPQLGIAELERWARSEARDGAQAWREFLAAAACSVLTLHALIAAAADPRTTATHARQIEVAYLPGCAIVTLLDGVIDAEHDAAARLPSYAGLYESPQLLAEALSRCAREACRARDGLPNGVHHATMLASAIAYWISAPEALSEAAALASTELRRELGGLLTPPLLLMRFWRRTKRLRIRGAEAASLSQREGVRCVLEQRSQ